jgi:hypothetical protein
MSAQITHVDPEETIRKLKAKVARLEKALAAQPAPVQEPYCFFYVENGEEYFAPNGAYVPDNAQPLYTTPPAQPTPGQERNFCERCGKRVGDYIHTCTPPAQPAPVQEKNT